MEKMMILIFAQMTNLQKMILMLSLKWHLMQGQSEYFDFHLRNYRDLIVKD